MEGKMAGRQEEVAVKESSLSSPYNHIIIRLLFIMRAGDRRVMKDTNRRPPHLTALENEGASPSDRDRERW